MENKKSITDAMSKKQFIGLLVACALYVIVLLLPLNGLEPAGQKALAALAWMIVVLITNCLPAMVANFIFAAIVILSGVMPQGTFLSTFGTSPFVLVLCMGIVALGMSKTNLGARVAFYLMKSIGRSRSTLLLAIMITGFITSALIANLPALLAICPIIISVLRALDEKPGQSDLGKALFIGLIWAGGAGGLCFISSAATNAAGVGAISSASEGQIVVSFSQFAAMGIPTGIVMLLSGWIFLTIWFKFRGSGNAIDITLLEREVVSMGKIDSAEIRYAVYLILMIVAFFVGGNYKIMPPTIAIIFAAIMLFPKIGLLTWQDVQKGTNWAFLFQIGFFCGFAQAISSTGLGEWLVTTFLGGMSITNPFLLLFITVCIGHICNILVPGGATALIVMPSVLALSSAAGIETAFLGLMVIFVACWSQFQPVQPQYLVVRGNTADYLQIQDFVLPNIIVTVIWTLLLVPLYYVLAPMAGLL